jgi:hypothetical protein
MWVPLRPKPCTPSNATAISIVKEAKADNRGWASITPVSRHCVNHTELHGFLIALKSDDFLLTLSRLNRKVPERIFSLIWREARQQALERANPQSSNCHITPYYLRVASPDVRNNTTDTPLWIVFQSWSSINILDLAGIRETRLTTSFGRCVATRAALASVA